MDVRETNHPILVITHNGVEVFECLFGDVTWRIEHCPSKLNTLCSTLQKDIKHYCKAKIISKQTDHGIPAPCYVGY
jgi:hypothetical protein